MVEKDSGQGLDVRRPDSASQVVERAEGMQVSREALLPPMVKLIQTTTAEAGKYGPGKFLRVDTEEVFDTLEVVPLVSRATQVKWPGGFNRDALPACWSVNGITAGQGAEREGQSCHSCPFFSPVPQRGKEGGMCETGHNVIFMEEGTFNVFGMRLRGTANRIMQHISSPGIAQRAVVRLYSEKVTRSGNTWYQLKVKTVRLLDGADGDLAVATMRSYLTIDLGVTELQAEPPGAGAEERSLPEEGGPSSSPGGGGEPVVRSAGGGGVYNDLPF